ncbi:AAA family ATPase [bacterium]|nr:AAA family ATPase [bacterium]
MIIVVMGVTGCGKTTLGRALAARLVIPFHDADDHHPETNLQKLRRDEPLDDADREDWLRIVASHIAEWKADAGAVLACSALKEAYRNVLREADSHIHLVYIECTRETIDARLRHRKGHSLVGRFDRIIEGQFRDLEPPRDAIRVSCLSSVEAAVEEVLGHLNT